MNQFSSNLHTVISNFKKRFLSIGLLLFAILQTGLHANAQCDVNPVANQTVCNNTAITAINFTGTATTFNWTNNTPSIGLAASGTGNIASFTALNATAAAVTATITVTPSTGACTGTPISFIITVNPLPVVNITPTTSCGGVAGIYGTMLTASASGPAHTFVWSPLAGLYTNSTTTTPYTGTQTAVVYAAPTGYTIYTVTGTNTVTGCIGTATTQVNYTPPAPVIVPSSVNMCLGDPAVKLRVASGTGFNLFCSGTVNIPIPDNNPAGAVSSVTVTGIPPTCTVTGMWVAINMPHTRAGNMVFVLKAPNGMVLNLDYHLAATGGSGATTGFVNTIISSTGVTALSAGTNPYTGTFRADAQAGSGGGFGAAGPTGMLPTATTWSSLFSANINGNWTLGFYDGVTGDVGTLTSWCLRIDYSCPPGIPARPAIWSPMAGLFSDPACTIPYVGMPTESVWTKPTPVGVYTYQATTTSVPGPPVAFTNPAAIAIPVGGAAALYPSDITVSGLPASGVKIGSVVLHGISHTRSEDIDVVLQSPSGQNIILMSDVGGANAINGTYTFMDWTPYMNPFAANPPGTYSPTNNGTPDNFPTPGPGNISNFSLLNTFTGNYNGTWKLFVVDDDGTSDQGMISGGYTINFDTLPACISPPRSVTVTVSMPVTITSQPANVTLCPANTIAVFMVSIAGGPVSFQWQVSTNGGTTWNNAVGPPYSGSNTATMTVNPVTAGMNGYLYRVVMNSGAGCSGATSNTALLTINPIPTVSITANPLIIGVGQTTTIFSTVTPNPAATYTWYYNNSILPGAVSSSLVVNYGSPGDYQLRVTDVNGCGVGVSNIITIANSFALNMYSYPNPSGGIFQVIYHHDPNSTTNNTLQRSLMVYNNWGSKIITRIFPQTTSFQKIDIDVRAHGKGIFWVEMRDANGKRLGMNRVVVQ